MSLTPAGHISDLNTEFCGIAALAKVLTLVDFTSQLDENARLSAMVDIHTLLVEKCERYKIQLAAAAVKNSKLK